ncbi:unnamed protein product [Musa textilis]
MIICNPFRNDETNRVTIHVNGALKQLPPRRHFVSSKLIAHRVSPHFKCLLFFEDDHFNEWGADTNLWYTMLSSNMGQSHNIYHLSQDVSPMFDTYDVLFGDGYRKLCIVREDETDRVLCFALNKSWTGRVRSLMGVSRGLAHFAFCDEHELHIYILVKEDGERVWKPKHMCSSQPLIKQHKELHRRRKDVDDERVFSILPLGFHPDLDIIFLQIEWRIYSFYLGSGSLDEVAGERGANPVGEKFLFHSFTTNPSASLGGSRSSLPDDLLVQILSRLPVKSTLRFRCVSKQWLALLSDRGSYSIRYLCPTIAVSSIDDPTSQGPGSTRPSTLIRITTSISTISPLIYLTIAT